MKNCSQKTVSIVKIIAIDSYGKIYGTPVDNSQNTDASGADIHIKIRGDITHPPQLNDTVLVSFAKDKRKKHPQTAHYIRTLKSIETTHYGVIVLYNNTLCLHTLRYKSNKYISLDETEKKKVSLGDYVRYKTHRSYNTRKNASALRHRRHDSHHSQKAIILDVIGCVDSANQYDVIATQHHNLRTHFSTEIQQHCHRLHDIKSDVHDDMISVPFVTIDPEDAKDHDDAVYCKPLDGGGFTIFVAIADVSFYVKSHDIVDREACLRGNSVYFPNRVIPMLPELLSNDLCSLKKGKSKYVLLCIMTINHQGQITDYSFKRSRVTIKENFSYEQAYTILQKHHKKALTPLSQNIQTSHLNYDIELCHLFQAYSSIKNSPQKNEALQIKSNEKKIIFHTDGTVHDIVPTPNLVTHEMIETFMIAANVCASEHLSKAGYTCLHRVHDMPSASKFCDFKDKLKQCDIKFSVSSPKPCDYNKLLQSEHNIPHDILSQMVMASQSKAFYSAKNIGHYGLQLTHYTHFTSPIRRYVDITIHRLLIENLENHTMMSHSQEDIKQLATHLSLMETSAVQAERDTMARLTASYYLDKIDTQYAAYIVATTTAGLFVRLPDTDREAFIPKRTLPIGSHHKAHTNRKKTQRNRHNKRVNFTIGQSINVKIKEVDPLTGSVLCHIV